MREGLRVGVTVESIDIMPTVLELAGLPVPEGIQGRSLVPLLEGAEPAAIGWEEWAAFSEKAVDQSPSAPARGDVESVAIHRGRWKLIHNGRRPEGVPEYELFDRTGDPGDRVNLAARHPEIVQSLSREIEARRREVEQIQLEREQTGASELDAEELERLRSLGYVQ